MKLIVFIALFANFTYVFADVNIAASLKVTSSPYMGGSLKYLTDKTLGEDEGTVMLKAPLPIKLGKTVVINYQFGFPEPMPVLKVRIYQFELSGRRWAKSFFITADMDGDAICETILSQEKNGVPEKWLEFSFLSHPVVYKLCFQTKALASGKGTNYGGPVLGEFEIYTTDMAAADLAENAVRLSPEILGELVVRDRRPPVARKPLALENRVWREQFARGIFASMWYFWEPGKDYEPQKQQIKLNRLKALGANRLWLYAGAYSKPDKSFLHKPEDEIVNYFLNRKNKQKQSVKILPFPSEVVTGYKKDILRDFSSHLNINNIGLIANEMMLPYGKSGWDFPRVNNLKEYPSLCSDFVQNKSSQLYQELMRGGANGLSLGGDEFFIYQGIDSESTESPVCFSDGIKKSVCKPECKDLFYQKFHFYPERETNNNFGELSAQWKVFQYRQIANWFSEYNKMMKLVDSSAISTTLFRSAEQNRVGYGVAYDVLGAEGNIDELSSNPYWSENSYLGHFIFSNETKKLVGANANRKATITLQATPFFKPKSYKNPLMVYGPAFASIMHGIKGINYYKFDYLNVATPRSAAPVIKKVFRFTKYLETININDFSIEKDVALLYSRASEDWWQLKYKKQGNKSLRGHLTQNGVMEVLFKESVPFDLFYLDQPDLFNNLDQYGVIILPFPYSISIQSYQKLNQLALNGTKILLVNKKGEVDELGVKYMNPLLDAIDKFIPVKIDFDNTNYKTVSDKLMAAVDNVLGRELTLSVNASGHDIECTVHSHIRNNDKLIFCLNWESKAYQVGFNLNVSNGLYIMNKVDMESIRSMAKVDGEDIFTAIDLKNFKINVKEGDAFVLRVQEDK